MLAGRATDVVERSAVGQLPPAQRAELVRRRVQLELGSDAALHTSSLPHVHPPRIYDIPMKMCPAYLRRRIPPRPQSTGLPAPVAVKQQEETATPATVGTAAETHARAEARLKEARPAATVLVMRLLDLGRKREVLRHAAAGPQRALSALEAQAAAAVAALRTAKAAALVHVGSDGAAEAERAPAGHVQSYA